ncbi:MAG: glycosyltransferase [Desulfovibrio sp.]|jgi:GT2 family glycosyltransferase/2-polyprenyl-3-methyl-5-hydroxy-6-metoxy-1,4-benzoquinol methylase|nr:glycosyltransferase [Desulfovibrio sp.]
MAKGIETSIIIPVYNLWEYTRPCLEALAATTAGKALEIIVVDNASSDATAEQCPLLGEQLFGSMFRYRRCPANLNFGPASNIGARLAKGEFLIFLNNDTVPLPGWYQPLLDDFSAYPDIAATGPVLLFPKSEPFGYTVQHLGVFVSPYFQVDHLYRGIPADCSLAKKRRFFQVVTAACMMIRRSLFLEIGLFDEHYINGFEDVDLCARLYSKGYRMTINPDSRVIHHTSQTPGRHRHEESNSSYLAQNSLSQLVPDWHLHLKNDGMFLKVGAWQILRGALPPEQSRRLDKAATTASSGELRELLAHCPLWENGWRGLIKKLEREGRDTYALELAMARFYPSVDGALRLYKAARRKQDSAALSLSLGILIDFCKPYEEYRAAAEFKNQWCADIGLDELAKQYAAWLAGADDFKTKRYLPFLEEFWNTAKHFPLPPHERWAYNLWRHMVDLPSRQTEYSKQPLSAPAGDIGFSILMPAYNPKPEHLAVALESVLAQLYPHWELCIADDASTDPEAKTLLENYAAKDARIRVTWRSENGHIAAATNTALSMARYSYVVLMDQDDTLTPDALLTVTETIEQHLEGLLFYSDEDKLQDDGVIFYPHFKNGKWDWELFYSQNFVNHLGVYRTDRMREIGGFREGYRASQDFDMLLRYTAGADAARLVHIPRVLYHWRAHGDSTARDVGVKNEAVDSGRRAVQAHMDIFSPGADACLLPGSQCLRVKFPLPEKRPLVTLLLDMGDGLSLLKAQISSLTDNTTYGKYEIVAMVNETVPKPLLDKAEHFLRTHKNVRLTTHAADLSLAARLNLGARLAKGKILGFFLGGIVPLTQGWIEELVSSLCREGVGAVGGKLIRKDGTLPHGGYLTDAGGRLAPVFRGLSRDAPGWFAWNKVARTVDALDSLCLFTRSETLAAGGGFDESSPDSAALDYCLRLGEKGLRSVWWPFAEFMLLDERTAHPGVSKNYTDDNAFAARWEGRLVPFNKNLVAAEGGWALNTGVSTLSKQPVPGTWRQKAVPAGAAVGATSPIEKTSGRLDTPRENPSQEKVYYGIIDLREKNNSHTQMFTFLKEHCDACQTLQPKILEIGCNTGYFSRLLRDNGMYVYGVEPATDEALKNGHVDELYLGSVEDFLKGVKKENLPLFDAILFGDVLEHLADPKSILQRIAKLLKPEGVIIASVPNVTHISVRQMLEDGQWIYRKYGLLDETHRYFFSRHSLRKLLITAGFGIERLYSVLVPGVEEYAPGILKTPTSGRLNENDHTFQIVIRASRKALPDNAFIHDLPRKILLCSPCLGGSLTKLRMIYPLAHYCLETGGELRGSTEPSRNDISWADVLVVHRECSLRMLNAIRYARSLGISIIYDLDDLLYELPNWSSLTYSYDTRGTIRHMVATADRVTCSTPALQAELAKLSDSVYVVKNAIFEQDHIDIEKKHTDMPCTFIIASSDTVQTSMLINPLKIFIKNNPQHQYVFIGPISNAFIEQNIAGKAYSQCALEEFSDILLSIDNGIGLIPLDDSLFSSCKSPIKFHHYARCGIVAVASSVTPYKEEIDHNRTGILTHNTVNGWVEAMTRISADAALRRLLLARAITYCNKTISPSITVKAWKDVFHGLPKPDVG